jgi:hypothetical protein
MSEEIGCFKKFFLHGRPEGRGSAKNGHFWTGEGGVKKCHFYLDVLYGRPLSKLGLITSQGNFTDVDFMNLHPYSFCIQEDWITGRTVHRAYLSPSNSFIFKIDRRETLLK